MSTCQRYRQINQTHEEGLRWFKEEEDGWDGVSPYLRWKDFSDIEIAALVIEPSLLCT